MAPHSPPRPAAARRGHGILILVVLLGLALVLFLYFGTMGGTSYTQQAVQARKQGQALAQTLSTQQLSILIAQYRNEHDRLPQSPADLDNEPAFRDQWGGPITFTFENTAPGAAGPPTIIYHSNGPDGEPGTGDDVEQRDTLPF